MPTNYMGFFDSGRKKKVTYKLVKKGKANYIGTTNNPKRRAAEHKKSGKKFDCLKVTSPRLSKSEAERREARNIKSYRKATKKNPRYNKTSDGKFKKRG
jgi:predicted GIY-YIG superfamily endonuclease